MGRTLVGSAGWLLLLGATLEPVQGSEQKSGGRAREMVSESSVARITRPASASLSSDATGSAAAPSSRERRAATGPVPELKPVTLFRFNTRLGEVAVQPVFGSVKGAQLSLGF